MAAEGLVTFAWPTKVTKRAVSRNASLPHEAFALQIRQNQGLQSFCRYTQSFADPLCKKFAMPLPPALAHHCFSRFRPKLIC